jgi:hypothetical protein
MRVTPKEIIQVQRDGVFVKTEVEVAAEDAGRALVEESMHLGPGKYKVMMFFFGMAAELTRRTPNYIDRRKWLREIRGGLGEDCVELLEGILNPPAEEG